MCFATVVVIITNSGVVTMYYKKDNKREAISEEVCAWVIIIGIVYIFATIII